MASYVNTWTIIDPNMRVQGIQTVSSVQNHPLGTKVQARDDGTGAFGIGEFVYLPGASSMAANDVCIINFDGMTVTRASAAASLIAPICVAMAATNATTKWGWYQTWGKGVVNSATVADNGLVYLTSTAGQVDDAVAANDRVKGMLFASANGTPDTGFAEVEMSYPFVDNGSAA